MSLFLFILQIIVSLLLIIVVLFQSSTEDSLSGIGAGAGKPNTLSRKSSTSFITKVTIILGVLLMINSFIFARMFTYRYLKNKNMIKDYIEQNSNEINNVESVELEKEPIETDKK